MWVLTLCGCLSCFQAKICVSGKYFWLTLIARRSRHFAGTRLLKKHCRVSLLGISESVHFLVYHSMKIIFWLRYLKRGVNEKGEVANDVEIEQIVSEDIPGGISSAIASVVQNRGSIPLFWSQQTSKFNLRPDIICMYLLFSPSFAQYTLFYLYHILAVHKKDKNFDATRLHFDNLVKRYGNPIIILNLIKVSKSWLIL